MGGGGGLVHLILQKQRGKGRRPLHAGKGFGIRSTGSSLGVLESKGRLMESA